MTSVQTAAGEPKTGLAIAGGIVAGFLTLALIGGGLWAAGRSGNAAEETAAEGNDPEIGSIVSAADLETGDCIDFSLGSSRTQFTLTGCDAPHVAEITSLLAHPEAGLSYPGPEAMGDWIAGRCATEVGTYTGTDLLETTLAEGALLPDLEAWSLGNQEAACYVTKADSTSLTESVRDAGTNYLRGDQVAVSRLIEGDCFTPADGTESFDLNSNSLVNLVSCDGGYNGIFFGRDTLDTPLGTLFPGEENIGEQTSQRCAELFQSHFSAEASGFNYRYWRPNQQSWDLDDRDILCAILDAEPLTDRFDPSQHRPFFSLQTGECFNLGPEETSDSLRLDDQVRVLSCDQSHVGQMIGSGNLEGELNAPFPQDDGILQLAGTECEQLFESFVGISPYQSDLGNFPFWYPNEPGWDDGDRRYACAFLGNETLTESLEDAETAS